MQVRYCKIILLWLGIVSTVFSCANVVRPSGGDKDSEGPKMIGAVPHPGSRNFSGREVVFYFDEYLKPGNYSKEVFISPIPSERPEVTVFNKKLTVRFRGPLRENTTYVITLGKEIKDFNEGNKMGEAFTYAFSTGEELDTLEIGGNIKSAWGNKGEDEMTVMLFSADEVADDSIFGKLPVYVIETDKKGDFRFRYLAEGKYRVYAVRDMDNDFSFSQMKEELALTDDPLVDLSDSAARKKQILMRSFQQDLEGVLVKNVRWANDKVVHVEFNDEPRDSFSGRTLQLTMQDTTGANPLEVKLLRYRDSDRKHMYFLAPHPRTQDWQLVFTNLMDSLGHQKDTVLRFGKDVIFKEDKGRFFDAPIFIPERNGLMLTALFPVPVFPDTNHCRILDSTGKKLSIRPLGEGFNLLFQLNTKVDPKMPYTVVIDSSFEFEGGQKMDTTLRIPAKFPDMAGFGSVSGTIIGDSTKPGMHYVVIITGPPGVATSKKEKPKNWVRRFTGPGTFSISHMPAGNYMVKIIEDADQNGFLTPGSLMPYKMPERMITGVAPIEVKGNWDLKNHKIIAVETVGKGGKGKLVGGSEEDVEGGGESEEEEEIPSDD